MSDGNIMIRCAVACYNAIGNPDLHFVKVRFNSHGEDLDNGRHYDAAEQSAKDNGYIAPMVVFDQLDTSGKAIVGILDDWDSPDIPTVAV